MNERTEYLACTLCFLVGGLAGAGAALLLATESGRNRRGRMGRRLRRAARSARDLTDRVSRRGEETGPEAVRRGDEAASAPPGNGGRKATLKDAI